jgi:hypothetical protein
MITVETVELIIEIAQEFLETQEQEEEFRRELILWLDVEEA